MRRRTGAANRVGSGASQTPARGDGSLYLWRAREERRMTGRTKPPKGRVYFRDVKPYEVVDSLDQPRGPAGGAGVAALGVVGTWRRSRRP